MVVNRIGDKKIYNLDERTLRFAKDVMDFVGILLRTLPNTEVIKQSAYLVDSEPIHGGSL